MDRAKSRLFKVFSWVCAFAAAAFLAVCLLIYPLWSDIHDYLHIHFPAMPIFTALMAGYLAWVIYQAGRAPSRRAVWIAAAQFILLAVQVSVTSILLVELGSERLLILRSARQAFPVVLVAALVAALVWAAPVWKPLQKRWARGAALACLAVLAAMVLTLPWRLAITAPPAVFYAPGGVNVTWGADLPALSWLETGDQPTLGQAIHPQANGLLALSDRIQSVYVPLPAGTDEFYFKAHSQGVLSYTRTTLVPAGDWSGPLEQVNLPAPGDEISLAAFSDLHERSDNYRRLAGNLPWMEMNLAVYLGDLVNSVAGTEMAAEAYIDLPTGGQVVPRILVRGNHDTRGEGARIVQQLLHPNGEGWYFSFTAGNVFFIVLDSGEDKASSDAQYNGMVDFASYHLQQAAWLKGVFTSPEYKAAAYRVALVHIPPFIYDDQEHFGEISPDFAPVADLLKAQTDIDLMMSGHIHQGYIWMPAQTGYPYPVTTCGGSQVNDMAAVTAHFGPKGIDLKVIDIDGKVVQQENILDSRPVSQ